MDPKDIKFEFRCENGFQILRNHADKYGVADEKGKIIVPFIYGWIGDFQEGFAPMRVTSLFGFINEQGDVMIPPIYEDVQWFREGLSLIKTKDNKWGYINTENQMVIPPVFPNALSFKNGFALVAANGMNLYIDKEMNYYNLDKLLIDCKNCKCLNDKLITGVCCYFGGTNETV